MFKKGFTLIELLVVIAVMAVIAAAVLVAIDPIDKINAANDSRVQADVGQIATAITTYAAVNGGVYPDTLQDLADTGELTRVPTPPANYECGDGDAYENGYSVDNTATPPTADVRCELKSKKYTDTPEWAWCSTSAGAGAVAAGDCP